ncbi:MAG: hypothetical protein WBC50_02915 [Dehalococcoidales bacterium]
MEKKATGIIKWEIQYIFQLDMYSRAYFAMISDIAQRKLEPESRTRGLPSQVIRAPALSRTEVNNTPKTTIIIATHCRGFIVSLSVGIAIRATIIGYVLAMGITSETSSFFIR